jgi:hypothetical protein
MKGLFKERELRKAPAAPLIELVDGRLCAYAGGYIYAISYGNSVTGQESRRSERSAMTGIHIGKDVKVSWLLPEPCDQRLDVINLYRSTDGGIGVADKLGLLKQVPIGSSPYIDSAPDETQGLGKCILCRREETAWREGLCAVHYPWAQPGIYDRGVRCPR